MITPERLRRLAVPTVAWVVVAWIGAGPAWTQPKEQQPAAGQAAAAPLTALVEQLVDLFPIVDGEVLEVQDATVILGGGVKQGMRPGLEVELFREGREIRHPKTGAVLGRTEQSLGKVRVAQAQEAFSVAPLGAVVDVKAGDRFRVSAAKVGLTLLPLLGGVRETLVEQATQDLVERLAASGRFRVTMGDAINVFLAERGLKAEDFLAGKGVKEAGERFKVDNILAIHFKRVQGKPFMDVRFFSLPQSDPAINTAFFVPPAIRSAGQTARFSKGGPANPQEAKPRSLLQRLLGGELDPNTYSSGEGAIPLRQVARFSFPVLAMDIAISPKDKVPRMVVSDGDQVYMYRIVEQKIEPEWTKSVRSLGQVFSLQLADLDGDGVLEVIGNRYDPRTEVNSFILTTRDGKPRMLIENVDDFLFAVDLRGEGIKQTLWLQRYSPTSFFTPGQVQQGFVKNGKLVTEKPVRVPAAFRPMGAAFSNIMGKDTRALAFIDEYNRLQIANEGEELWRSSSPVGGGVMKVEQPMTEAGAGRQGGRSRFIKIEPTPLAVDLDGDGIDELVVPQNVVKEGLLAVVFKGPAGFRLQTINSGFEGFITCLGAYRTEDSTQPTVIASVVRFTNAFNSLLKLTGETQIIMTVPQE